MILEIPGGKVRPVKAIPLVKLSNKLGKIA